jgi:glutamine synthetase
MAPFRSWAPVPTVPPEAPVVSVAKGESDVDVRFCDLPGIMQHFTVPVEVFDPEEELTFDGSSIRAFQATR